MVGGEELVLHNEQHKVRETKEKAAVPPEERNLLSYNFINC